MAELALCAPAHGASGQRAPCTLALDLSDGADDRVSLAALTSRSSLASRSPSRLSTRSARHGSSGASQRPPRRIKVGFDQSDPSLTVHIALPGLPPKATVVTLPSRQDGAADREVPEAGAMVSTKQRARQWEPPQRTLQQVREHFINLLTLGGNPTWSQTPKATVRSPTKEAGPRVPVTPGTPASSAKRKARGLRQRESETAGAPPFEASAAAVVGTGAPPSTFASTGPLHSRRSSSTRPSSASNHRSSSRTSEVKSRPRPPTAQEDIVTPPKKAHPASSLKGPSPPPSSALPGAGVRVRIGVAAPMQQSSEVAVHSHDSWGYEKIQGFAFNPAAALQSNSTGPRTKMVPLSSTGGKGSGGEKTLPRVNSLPSIGPPMGISAHTQVGKAAAREVLQIGSPQHRFF